MNYFNNIFHVLTPNTMPHAYSGQNDLINEATIEPTSPNIAIPPALNPILNNAGGVAISNTSATKHLDPSLSDLIQPLTPLLNHPAPN